MALRCNEALCGQQVLTFQIRLRRHFWPPEPSLAPTPAGPRRYAHDHPPASSDLSICHHGSRNAPARLRSGLAAAAGPRLGSAKAPALPTAWRRLVRCQRHASVLPVRPHDARAHARTTLILLSFRRYRVAFGRHALVHHCIVSFLRPKLHAISRRILPFTLGNVGIKGLCGKIRFGVMIIDYLAAAGHE
jgi:hypothetical protein